MISEKTKRIAPLLVLIVVVAAASVALIVEAAAEPSSEPVVIQDAEFDQRSPGADGDATAEAVPAAARSQRPRRSARTLADLEPPPGAHPVIWVRAGERAPMRTERGGGELVEAVGRRTEFGSPTVFGVVRSHGDWAAVSSPSLPNGVLGWIRFDPERLRVGLVETSVLVDLSERRATLIERGEVVRSFAVTVGAPGSTTPTGRFAITDTFRGDLAPAYGCCAVAISATQPNLPSGWFGGNRIAIHGTSGPLGVAASHGCVRAADRDVAALVRRIELGSPVTIRP